MVLKIPHPPTGKHSYKLAAVVGNSLYFAARDEGMQAMPLTDAPDGLLYLNLDEVK